MRVKVFTLILTMAVLSSWCVVFPQTGVKRYTLILQLTDDYDWAVHLAEKASEELNLKLDLGDITYSKQHGRITSSSCDSVISCSEAERFQPGEYISLGNSKDYRIEGPERIAIIAGLYEGKYRANYALKKVKPLYKQAFVQVDTGYPSK